MKIAAVVLVVALVASEGSRAVTPDWYHDGIPTPPCAGVECGEIICRKPFKLIQDGTCCGYCGAPDHVVPRVDGSTGEPSPYLKEEKCPGAPVHCRGAKCFEPSCPAGNEPKCDPGACCYSCNWAR